MVANKSLVSTERAKDWLEQFSPAEADVAMRLLNSLTLVSHSTFERIIRKQLESIIQETSSRVAFFAARELKGANRDNFISAFIREGDADTIDSLPRGSDVGSEARIATIIRAVSKAYPERAMNHPTLEAIRKAECGKLVVVDDLIGSGGRITEFISALWESKTLRSWNSLKYLKISVVSYASTEMGDAAVTKLKCKPHIVVDRKCPTLATLPWSESLRAAVRHLCKINGRRTSRRSMALGYKKTMATLVFEHGCPNNVPAILWAPPTTGTSWRPMFPNQAVLSSEASSFPPELLGTSAATSLRDVGDSDLAEVREQGPLALSDSTLLALAFSAKGVRSTTALSFATGMDEDESARCLDRCVDWGFISSTRRITARGLRELREARQIGWTVARVAPRGEDYYYPKMLRGSHTNSATRETGSR